jgi:hypothetical protein
MLSLLGVSIGLLSSNVVLISYRSFRLVLVADTVFIRYPAFSCAGPEPRLRNSLLHGIPAKWLEGHDDSNGSLAKLAPPSHSVL